MLSFRRCAVDGYDDIFDTFYGQENAEQCSDQEGEDVDRDHL